MANINVGTIVGKSVGKSEKGTWQKFNVLGGTEMKSSDKVKNEGVEVVSIFDNDHKAKVGDACKYIYAGKDSRGNNKYVFVEG